MTNVAKQQLRQELLGLRPGSSQGISEQLMQLATKLNAKRIASYQPTASEPDITRFNNWAAENLELFFPRIEGDDLVFASGTLFPGAFGLLEPGGEAIDLGKLDLFVIPALAADRHGNRLGKGKGYYDRLLERVSTPSCAVVFESEMFEKIETEDHDQKVTFVITPSKTHRAQS